MRPLNHSTLDGPDSVGSPDRGLVAIAGSAVLATAIIAFNLGLSTEWHRPVAETGTPIQAVSAIALNAEQIPAMVYALQETFPEKPAAPGPPLAAARVTEASAAPLLVDYATPRPVTDALSPAVQTDAAAMAPVAQASPLAQTADPVGDLISAY